MYGVMDEVVQVRGDVQGVPAALVPPSFNPATIMQETLDEVREAKKRAGEN